LWNIQRVFGVAGQIFGIYRRYLECWDRFVEYTEGIWSGWTDLWNIQKVFRMLGQICGIYRRYLEWLDRFVEYTEGI
jgi:hypothetical protein